MDRFLISAAGAALLVSAFWLPAPVADETTIKADINALGSATFWVEQDGNWEQSWFVSCGSPLRDCVARSNGAILRLNETGQPLLFVSTGAGGTLLLRDEMRKGEEWDITSVLSRPMTADEVKYLSRPGMQLVLASKKGTEVDLQMMATDQVVSYLQWLSSPTARGLRDARQWSTEGSVEIGELDPAQLERYRAMQSPFDANLAG